MAPALIPSCQGRGKAQIQRCPAPPRSPAAFPSLFSLGEAAGGCGMAQRGAGPRRGADPRTPSSIFKLSLKMRERKKKRGGGGGLGMKRERRQRGVGWLRVWVFAVAGFLFCFLEFLLLRSEAPRGSAGLDPREPPPGGPSRGRGRRGGRRHKGGRERGGKAPPRSCQRRPGRGWRVPRPKAGDQQGCCAPEARGRPDPAPQGGGGGGGRQRQQTPPDLPLSP